MEIKIALSMKSHAGTLLIWVTYTMNCSSSETFLLRRWPESGDFVILEVPITYDRTKGVLDK
jgi:hypothetical protein